MSLDLFETEDYSGYVAECKYLATLARPAKKSIKAARTDLSRLFENGPLRTAHSRSKTTKILHYRAPATAALLAAFVTLLLFVK